MQIAVLKIKIRTPNRAKADRLLALAAEFQLPVLVHTPHRDKEAGTLRTLELAPLTSKSRSSWMVRLRYAYADTLEEAGREEDAQAWFHRTHAIDSDELTDAAERAEILERRQS